MKRAALGIGAALGVAVAAVAAEGRAESPAPFASAPGPRILWEAPEECPDAQSISSRLREELAAAPAGAGEGFEVRGRITRGGQGRWVLSLEVEAPAREGAVASSHRTLDARYCDDLGDAAAVAIAIAVGIAAPGSAPLDGHASPSEPPPGTAAEASPALDTGAAAVSDARSAPARGLGIAADAVLDSASLGGLSAGASLALHAWLERFRVGLYGAWLPGRDEPIAAGQRVEFALRVLGLRACYEVPADWLTVAGCAGAEVGQLDARSEGLALARDSHDPWFAPSASLTFGAQLSRALGVHSRIEALFPVERQNYRVDLGRTVQTVPAAALRWSVGVDADVLSL